MAKRRKTSVASHQGVMQTPDFEYDVKSTFLPVEAASTKYSKQAKGVLDLMRLRPARPEVRGDIALRFLTSRTLPTHSDIIHTSGLNTQPVMEVNVGGMPYTIASRYTVRPGRRGPIDMGLMLDGPLPGDIRDQRNYDEALYVASLAIATAVLRDAKEADPNTVGFNLTVSDNFASGGVPDITEVTAGSITELHSKLNV